MYPGWAEIFDEFFDPGCQYTELVVAAGMKAGKSYHVGGLISCYEMYLLSQYDNPALAMGLDPDSWIWGLCAARNRKQAKNAVFAEFLAKAKRCPAFQELDCEATTMEFKIYDKKLGFTAAPSNSDAMVSNTLAFGILDEMSRFKTTSGDRGARPVYEAVSSQLALLNGRLYVISSPLYEDDYVMQLLKKAKNNPHTLGIQKATWELNPNMPRDHPAIVAAFEKNPEAANRDFGARPSKALAPFFRQPERLDACINLDTRHPLDAHGTPHTWFVPLTNQEYVIAGDPAYKNDAFGFAMGHIADGIYVLDLMHRFYNEVGEIDALEPRTLVDDLHDAGFLMSMFMFDTWQFPETIQHIRSLGIDTIRHTVDLGTYSFLKELAYSGKLEVYDHAFALDELKSLELIKGSKVDHRSGFSKDIADAIANVCWGLRTPMAQKYDSKVLLG